MEFKCEFCLKSYHGRSGNKNLQNHLIHCEFNPTSIPFKCDKCGNENFNRHKYSRHVQLCGKPKVIKIKKWYPKKKKNYCDLIYRNCYYCDYETCNPYKFGSHISCCKSNPDYKKILEVRIKNGKIPRKHTEDTKRKISEGRIKFLLENPDKVPYLLNHSSKESYPEKYFAEVFHNESIIVERYVRIGTYQLDFAIVEKKIDIEIDGDQHTKDIKIVESDIRRNKFLQENGWSVIRINWSDYKKMSFLDKKKYIEDLKLYLDK